MTRILKWCSVGTAAAPPMEQLFCLWRRGRRFLPIPPSCCRLPILLLIAVPQAMLIGWSTDSGYTRGYSEMGKLPSLSGTLLPLLRIRAMIGRKADIQGSLGIKEASEHHILHQAGQSCHKNSTVIAIL